MSGRLAWGDAGRPQPSSPDHRPRHTDTAHAPSEQRLNAALTDLRSQLGDDEAVDRFMANYLALLDKRVETLGRLIDERKAEEGITLLLTLETSSDMVGATELSLKAMALRLALGHCPANTDALYRELAGAASRAAEMLTSH